MNTGSTRQLQAGAARNHETALLDVTRHTTPTPTVSGSGKQTSEFSPSRSAVRGKRQGRAGNQVFTHRRGDGVSTTPHSGTWAQCFRGHSLHLDRPLPGSGCRTASRVQLPGADWRCRCRSARRCRRCRPESATAPLPHCDEPRIHGPSP